MEHRTNVTITYKIEGEDREYEMIIPIKGDENTTVNEIFEQFSKGVDASVPEVIDEFSSALTRHMFIHTSG